MAAASSWSIDPSGVSAVLNSVKTHAEALGTSLSGLETDLNDAVTNTQSQAIASAIVAWMGTESPALTGVTTRITAAVTGAVKVTEAYVAHDYSTAAEIQAKQVAAADPQPDLQDHWQGGGKRLAF